MSILNVIGFKFHEYDEDSNVSYTGHELIAKNKFDEYFSIKLSYGCLFFDDIYMRQIVESTIL